MPKVPFRLTLGFHFIMILIFLYLFQICGLQMKEKMLRDSRKNETKHEIVEGKKKLYCGKCKAYACSTDDIRIIKVCFCTGSYIHDHQRSQHYWTNCIVYQCGSGLFYANWRRIEILSKSVNHRNSCDYFCSMMSWVDVVQGVKIWDTLGITSVLLEPFWQILLKTPWSSTT